jgi:hypothetical protein
MTPRRLSSVGLERGRVIPDRFPEVRPAKAPPHFCKFPAPGLEAQGAMLYDFTYGAPSAVRVQLEQQAGAVHRTPEEGHPCPGGFGA